MIEFTIQSITLQPEDIQKYFPALAVMIDSSMAKRKRSKRRKPRKKRITAGHLIQEIIDSIDE